jgi:hypothetical protein
LVINVHGLIALDEDDSFGLVGADEFLATELDVVVAPAADDFFVLDPHAVASNATPTQAAAIAARWPRNVCLDPMSTPCPIGAGF